MNILFSPFTPIKGFIEAMPFVIQMERTFEIDENLIQLSLYMFKKKRETLKL